MLKSRSQKIDLDLLRLNSLSEHERNSQSCRRFSWRSSLLCGIYTEELTSSIFFCSEEEVEAKTCLVRKGPSCQLKKSEQSVIPSQTSHQSDVLSNSIPNNQRRRFQKQQHIDNNNLCENTGDENQTRQDKGSMKTEFPWPTNQSRAAVINNIKREKRSHSASPAPKGLFQKKVEKNRKQNNKNKQNDKCYVDKEEDIDSERLHADLKQKIKVVLCEAVATKNCYPSPYDKQALPFRQGDQIAVLEMNPNGIWRGRCNDREGNFKFIDVKTEKCHQQRRVTRSPTRSTNRKIPRSKSVSDLLSEMSLENLTPLFVLNGYDNAEDIQDISEADLEYLGISDTNTQDIIMETASCLKQDTNVKHESNLDLKANDTLPNSNAPAFSQLVGSELHQIGQGSFLHCYKGTKSERSSGTCLGKV